MNKKLVMIIRAWLRIENEEHRHWCCYTRGDEDVIPGDERCYHSGVCWYCTDPFCAGLERKDCPNCEKGQPKTCKGRIGVRDARCTCGYGRD